MTPDRNTHLQRIYRAALIMAVCEVFGNRLTPEQYKTVHESFGLEVPHGLGASWYSFNAWARFEQESACLDLANSTKGGTP